MILDDAGIGTALRPALRAVIIHQQTLGLRHDALVLARALERAVPQLAIVSLEVPGTAANDYDTSIGFTDAVRRLTPFHAAFFLEHAYANHPFLEPAFCRKRVYVPNAEWITEQDERAIGRRALDVVLYKNALNAEVFEALDGARDIPVREMTGWTSIDIGAVGDNGEDDGEPRDFTGFLHVRGISEQKQTAVVIETWLQCPDFTPLTVVATMRDGFTVSAPVRASNNVEILLRQLSEHELRRLQRRHAIHLCPSEAEGFGHSLNEARACSSLLITTDGAPMSDLVVPGETGMLVPVRPGDRSLFHRAPRSRIRPEELAETVRAVIRLPLEEKRRMGGLAREHYLRDQRRFEAEIARIFGPDGPAALA